MLYLRHHCREAFLRRSAFIAGDVVTAQRAGWCAADTSIAVRAAFIADRISSLIVGSDYPMIDIEIEKQKFREKISELFPDKIDLYDLIYEPRFRRLKEQFRE